MFDFTPHFPQDLENYAPWVSTYGLTAPYGLCQCTCGKPTKLATANRPQFGEARHLPCRNLKGHGNRKYPLADNPNPSGLCLCGCGQLTPISRVTRNNLGYVKGQRIRYVPGHGNAKRYTMQEPNPSGLCMCGCGQLAPIAQCTIVTDGLIAGKPVRFIHNHHHNIGPSLEERFWEKVNQRGPDDCWEWTGSRNGAGYGKFSVDGETDYAHHAAYGLVNGPISDGLFVLHKCDNPPCVNPAHLFAGSHQDNMDDMVSKGRHLSHRAARHDQVFAKLAR